jgi:hypothetical protein
LQDYLFMVKLVDYLSSHKTSQSLNNLLVDTVFSKNLLLTYRKWQILEIYKKLIL